MRTKNAPEKIISAEIETPHLQSITTSPEGGAKYLGISRAGFYRLIATGQIVAKKCGRRTLVSFADIDLLLERMPPCIKKPGDKNA